MQPDLPQPAGDSRAFEPTEEDFSLAELLTPREAVGVLAEWCLHPLNPEVLRSLDTRELARRWRAARVALRCGPGRRGEALPVDYLRAMAGTLSH